MLTIKYCSKCHQKIEEMGEVALTTFENICEHYILTNSPFEIIELEGISVIETIRELEILGYLTSREFIENGIEIIKVKPNGLIRSSYMFFSTCLICFDKENHIDNIN